MRDSKPIIVIQHSPGFDLRLSRKNASWSFLSWLLKYTGCENWQRKVTKREKHESFSQTQTPRESFCLDVENRFGGEVRVSSYIHVVFEGNMSYVEPPCLHSIIDSLHAPFCGAVRFRWYGPNRGFSLAIPLQMQKGFIKLGCVIRHQGPRHADPTENGSVIQSCSQNAVKVA